MATTLRLFLQTEETKEKCLTDLKNARQFIVDFDKKYPATVDFKVNDEWSKNLDEFLQHYDSFVESVDKNTVDEDGEMKFIDIEQFPTSDNDIELGQLDFKNSLSLDNPYDNQVDSNLVQMCVDRLVELLSEEMDKTDYGIGGDMNDDYEDYSETYTEFGI